MREQLSDLGYSSFAATNLVWAVAVFGGALPQLAYCAYLLHRRDGEPRVLLFAHSVRERAIVRTGVVFVPVSL